MYAAVEGSFENYEQSLKICKMAQMYRCNVVNETKKYYRKENYISTYVSLKDIYAK